MKRFLVASGITLCLIYLLHQVGFLQMGSTKHLDTLFLMSVGVLFISACIHVAQTSFWKLFMHGWKQVGRVFFKKPFSMQAVDDMIQADSTFNEWKKRLTEGIVVYAFGSGAALFGVVTVVSFSV